MKVESTVALDSALMRPVPDRSMRAKVAAEQFEGLMISELLKSANSATDALRSGDSDESLSTALQFAHEQLAQALSERGGLGLAKIVRSSLER